MLSCVDAIEWVRATGDSDICVSTENRIHARIVWVLRTTCYGQPVVARSALSCSSVSCANASAARSTGTKI